MGASRRAQPAFYSHDASRRVRLEHRGTAEDEAAARDEYLELIGISPGKGSGVVTRAIAKRVAPQGRVVVRPMGESSNSARLAVTVLAHVPGAERALAEMARVTRRGGRVGVGAITEAERKEWLAPLEATISAGRFIGGRLHLLIWGTRR